MPPGPRSVQTERNVTHILLRGPDGHLHLRWKALVNGRAILLLAARLTITQARRKRTGALAGNTSSNAAPGLPGTPNPRPAAGPSVPGQVGVAHRNQAPEPAGHQPAGAPVNAWTRTAVTYPGFT